MSSCIINGSYPQELLHVVVFTSSLLWTEVHLYADSYSRIFFENILSFTSNSWGTKKLESVDRSLVCSIFMYPQLSSFLDVSDAALVVFISWFSVCINYMFICGKTLQQIWYDLM